MEHRVDDGSIIQWTQHEASFDVLAGTTMHRVDLVILTLSGSMHHASECTMVDGKTVLLWRLSTYDGH